MEHHLGIMEDHGKVFFEHLASIVRHVRRMKPSRNDPSTIHLSPHDERRVAVLASCDPRTVRAYLRGDPIRSTTAPRIAEALRSLGFSATRKGNPTILENAANNAGRSTRKAAAPMEQRAPREAQ